MGRGPVWGIITRLAGGAGAAGEVEATAGSGLAELTGAGVELAAIDCSASTAGAAGTAGAGGTSTATGGACGTLVAAGATLEAAGAAGLVSGVFAGTATTAEAPVKPDDGGFTITGPCGARDAMAGVGVGAVDTICGAWRGNGTILRGAGFEPAAALADTELADVALAGVPAVAALLPEGAVAEEPTEGAETVGLAAPAAAVVPVGRGGAAVTGRCSPCDSRCSFCC